MFCSVLARSLYLKSRDGHVPFMFDHSLFFPETSTWHWRGVHFFRFFRIYSGVAYTTLFFPSLPSCRVSFSECSVLLTIAKSMLQLTKAGFVAFLFGLVPMYDDQPILESTWHRETCADVSTRTSEI